MSEIQVNHEIQAKVTVTRKDGSVEVYDATVETHEIPQVDLSGYEVTPDLLDLLQKHFNQEA